MQTILVTAVIMVSLAAVGHALSCYNCRSDKVPECGKTFSVPEREKGSYIGKCDDLLDPIGCNKIITEEYNQALAGKCVVCRSDRVAGCGETMDPKIINDHIQQCNSSSCDKRINEEFHTVVIRQCGLDGNFDEEYYSAKCKEMTNIKVCKCRGDVCNGQSNIVSSLTVLTSAVLAALVLLR